MCLLNLTDEEWLIIEPLLPKKKLTRPPRWSKRQILDGIFYNLKNGCNWADLPKDLPPIPQYFGITSSGEVMDLSRISSRASKSYNLEAKTLL